MDIFLSILIGIIAGILGGMFGLGGGSIIVPALVIFLGYSQHLAQGISVAAMIPPVGALAAYHYWKQGNVNWGIAIIIALGFFFGSYFGAYIANLLEPKIMKKMFGFFLLIIAVQMIIKK